MINQTYPTLEVITVVPPQETYPEKVIEQSRQWKTDTGAWSLMLPSADLARLARGSWIPIEEGEGTSVEIVRRMRDEWEE